MLKNRIIPCLDVKEGRVVKGINFVDLIDAGDPVEQASIYNQGGADEICFLDITASSDKRDILFDSMMQYWSEFAKTGDPNKAVSYYLCSRRYFGDGYEVLLNLGDCYHDLGRHQEALDCLRAALSFNPKDASTLELVAAVESAISMVSSSS